MTASRRAGTLLALCLTASALAVALPAAAGAAPAAPAPAPAARTHTATGGTATSAAAPKPSPAATTAPATVSLQVGGGTPAGKPNSSLVVVLGLAVLSIAPALLVLTTSFTKIVVVLSLTRNALGLQNIPPNQVLAGLALFLSLFLMGPVLSKVNQQGVQPYLHGTKTQQQAYTDGVAPLKTWMLHQTRREDIGMLTAASHQPKPKDPQSTSMATLVPAFVLSELRGAFIIGLVVFVPFLVIDLVVSSSLMGLGMMMVPPVLVSLPFKILMFVLVDGWALIVKSLLASYH